MREGRLSFEDRNTLLDSMTDSVAAIVLEDNRLQALGLSIAQAGGASALPSYVRLIEIFENNGQLDRREIGRASCRERVGQYVSISVGAVALKKNKHETYNRKNTEIKKK